MSTLSVVAVVVPAVVGGLLFAPAFSLRTLLAPVLLATAVVLVVDAAVANRPALSGWRSALTLLLGALALSELLLRPTLVGGVVPTASTVRAFADAVVHGWRRTLETSWPAPAEAALVLGVPVVVLLAALAAVEILRRAGRPLLALAPGLAVVVLSQTFSAAQGALALTAGLVCAAAVAALFALNTGTSDVPTASARRSRRRVRPTRAGVVTVAVSGGLTLAVALGAVAAGMFDPAGRAPLALDRPAPAARPSVVTSPLDQIGERLSDPDAVAFTVRTAAPVDRWTLAVLDRFDGVNWTASPHWQRLGTELSPARTVTVPTRAGSAQVSLLGLPSVWLPTQDRTVAVTGATPLVDASTGVLLADGDTRNYTVDWNSPTVSAHRLGSASLAGGPSIDLGEVPDGFAELAATAVGNRAPSFKVALLLESYLRRHYTLATDQDLPTGHGYPQLDYFLTQSKRGTSEQFAAAYVVLAQQLGISARIAVGFKQPAATSGDTYVVRNSDVFAWPEVAVAGVGWVPLDPTGSARTSASGADGALAQATQQARDALPPPDTTANNTPPPDEDRSAAVEDGGGSRLSMVLGVVRAVALALAAVVLLVLIGVPLAKAVRRRRRRHRPATRQGVLGAWLEARDRLRDHGIVAGRSMTVRDLADCTGVPGLDRLAGCVDRALWSAELVFDDVADQAWKAVDQVRDGLRTRPWRARLRAAIDPRSLLSKPPMNDPTVGALAAGARS